MINNNNNNKGLKSYVWLFLAVICIVFSSASKRVIEQKVGPSHNNTALSFSKKIKDGSRDRHEYLSVAHTGGAHTGDFDFSTAVVLSSLISLGFLSFFSGSNRQQKTSDQQLAFAGLAPLYIRQHRLQV